MTEPSAAARAKTKLTLILLNRWALWSGPRNELLKLRMAISTLEKSAKATTERNRVILKCPISVSPDTGRDSIGFPLSTVVNRRFHQLLVKRAVLAK